MLASTIFLVKWHISLLCLDIPVFISAAVSSSLIRLLHSSCQRARARSRSGAVKGMMDMMSAVMVTLLKAVCCALARRPTERRGRRRRRKNRRIIQPVKRSRRRRRKRQRKVRHTNDGGGEVVNVVGIAGTLLRPVPLVGHEHVDEFPEVGLRRSWKGRRGG